MQGSPSGLPCCINREPSSLFLRYVPFALLCAQNSKLRLSLHKLSLNLYKLSLSLYELSLCLDFPQSVVR